MAKAGGKKKTIIVFACILPIVLIFILLVVCCCSCTGCTPEEIMETYKLEHQAKETAEQYYLDTYGFEVEIESAKGYTSKSGVLLELSDGNKSFDCYISLYDETIEIYDNYKYEEIKKDILDLIKECGGGEPADVRMVLGYRPEYYFPEGLMIGCYDGTNLSDILETQIRSDIWIYYIEEETANVDRDKLAEGLGDIRRLLMVNFRDENSSKVWWEEYENIPWSGVKIGQGDTDNMLDYSLLIHDYTLICHEGNFYRLFDMQQVGELYYVYSSDGTYCNLSETTEFSLDEWIEETEYRYDNPKCLTGIYSVDTDAREVRIFYYDKENNFVDEDWNTDFLLAFRCESDEEIEYSKSYFDSCELDGYVAATIQLWQEDQANDYIFTVVADVPFETIQSEATYVGSEADHNIVINAGQEASVNSNLCPAGPVDVILPDEWQIGHNCISIVQEDLSFVYYESDDYLYADSDEAGYLFSVHSIENSYELNKYSNYEVLGVYIDEFDSEWVGVIVCYPEILYYSEMYKEIYFTLYNTLDELIFDASKCDNFTECDEEELIEYLSTQ